MPKPLKTHLLTALFGAIWIAAVASGLWVMLNYESTPGTAAGTPEAWPSASQIERSADRPTLVMLAHPHCPCTRASVAELAQIMAHAQGKVSAHVLFWKPANAGADWEDTSLRQGVAAIPGVKAISDVDGVEARRFGAETSGHALLYAADGRLLFSGGITGARGHSGNNAGETTIVALLHNQPARQNRSLVFGCSFTAPPASAEKAAWLK